MARGLRVLSVALIALAAVLLLPPNGVRALAPPSPWDGTNPFDCVIQDAGIGTAVPDPGADPYCVRFDKTHQNLTGLGIADFLLKEPARVAAASPKCFYFQEDHWRGTVSQSDPTAIYEFVGHYFFNKATGDGGAWVTDFTLEGQTFDPTTLPGFPPGYGPYFGPGTGGFISHDSVPVDPHCVALAQQSPVYPPPSGPQCVPDAGHVSRVGLGPLVLGETEDRVRAQIGPPLAVKRGFLHYCVEGGGTLLVGQPGDRSGAFGAGGHDPTVMLLTTARGFVLSGRRGRLVAAGASRRALHRAFPGSRRIARIGAVRVLRLRGRLIAGVRRRRVVFLGVYDRRAIARRSGLISYLRRAR